MAIFNKIIFILLALFMTTNSALAKTEKKAGQLISAVVLDPDLGLRQTSKQYRISYTSTDKMKGNRIREDTGMVFIPKGNAPRNGWPVVVWEHGTVGIATHCAPSLNKRSANLAQYLNTWLSLGFAIVAPDYAGLGSAGPHYYLDTKAVAWSSLDAARATLGYFPFENKFLFVGHSQGAHAAFSSLAYHGEYAPKLNIIGGVLTGTPYFDPYLIRGYFNDEGEVIGQRKIAYVIYLFLTAQEKNPALKAEDYFQSNIVSIIEQAKYLCINDLGDLIAKNRINADNGFKNGILNFISEELSSLSYTTLKVNIPIFIGIGLEDSHVPAGMQQQFANDLLNAATPATVEQYIGIDHLDIYNVSLRGSLPFVYETMKLYERYYEDN